MKNLKMRKKYALIISAIAMTVAAASTAMCFLFIFDEPKMPKSLYKVD